MTTSDSTQERRPLAGVMLAALGVVYGDIGTSPLYAIKECFAGPHPLSIDQGHVLGILSLVFWSVTVVVSLKYVVIILRADNKGEGGSLALLALVSRMASGTRLAPVAMGLGVFAAALFYGDSMITPAISVLSAVEGLEIVTPAFKEWVLPLSLMVLIGLFVIQRRGTAAIGRLFGPVMAIWFFVLAILGVLGIADHPDVLFAIDPRHGFHFMLDEGALGFLVLGSVVLVLTGAEALYADMGHFGARPIRFAWFQFVMPALLLNYFGQGARLLADPTTIENPFYRMVPEWGLLPLVVLSTLATVIASQAVISGAFSVTRQAIQLGLLPRMGIVHTSEREIGQIYIPFINWALLGAIIMLVVDFKTSSRLAVAYGVAVTGTMLITTLQIGVVMALGWRWGWVRVGAIVGLLLAIDVAFFSANIVKIGQGGWLPLAIGFGIYACLTTWQRGRALLIQRMQSDALPVDTFLRSISARIRRVPGTAVFLTGASSGIPHAMLHNLKHNMVLHERNVLLTVIVEDVPHIPEVCKTEIHALGENFFRVTEHYGFIDEPDVPAALRRAQGLGLDLDWNAVSYFIGRETILPSALPGMSIWREALFAWMSRNASGAMRFFCLPPNRVVEVGSQVEI